MCGLGNRIIGTLLGSYVSLFVLVLRSARCEDACKLVVICMYQRCTSCEALLLLRSSSSLSLYAVTVTYTHTYTQRERERAF